MSGVSEMGEDRDRLLTFQNLLRNGRLSAKRIWEGVVRKIHFLGWVCEWVIVKCEGL